MDKRSLPIAAVLCLAISPLAIAQTWSPSPHFGNAALHQRMFDLAFTFAETHFDPAVNLIGVEGKEARDNDHMIRESGLYAYALLLTGKPADRDRAQAILRVVFTKQDLRKDSPTYGCFTTSFETDWATWVKPDLNWAEFMGALMAHIIWLDNHRHLLNPALRTQLDQSFSLTVQAAMRRNVDPTYTNIALLTSAVVSAGAQLENIPGAAGFAQKKLQDVYDMAGKGTFCEYLSPTYYGSDFYALYSAQRFACSDTYADLATRTLDLLWRDTAASYHQPTFQLAGPASRSYGDNMLEYGAMAKYFIYLALDGKYPMPDDVVAAPHAFDLCPFMIMADCPIEARQEFTQPTAPWREVLAYEDPAGFKRFIRQYRDGDFILGTVSEKDEWEQSRNIIAYWPRPDGDHLGLCQDVTGRTAPVVSHTCDFYSTQSGPVVLAAMIETGTDTTAPVASRLMFNEGATITAEEKAPLHYIIKSAPIEATLYPITHADGHMTVKTVGKDGDMSVKTMVNGTCLDRPFASGDPAANKVILAYLLTFRLPNHDAPKVTNLTLETGESSATLSATVDGKPITVEIPYKSSPMH